MKKALRVLMLIWALVPLSNQTLKGMSNIQEEIWKDVPGFEGIYAASSLGRIKSKARLVQNGRYKTFKQDKYLYLNLCKKNGYIKVYLCVDKKMIYTTAHQLVAKTFIPNPNNKPCVNHKNGIKTDNRVENLEWMTVKENTHHAIDMGLAPSQKGETNNKARLTETQVLEIRNSYHYKGYRKGLAEKYGVTVPYISKIFNKQTWKHL